MCKFATAVTLDSKARLSELGLRNISRPASPSPLPSLAQQAQNIMAHRTREPAQLAKVLRHTRYYLRGGDITFLVGLVFYHTSQVFLDLILL